MPGLYRDWLLPAQFSSILTLAFNTINASNVVTDEVTVQKLLNLFFKEMNP